MNKQRISQPWLANKFIGFVLLGLLLLSGCTTVQKAPVKQVELNCGLIGKYCGMLTTGTDEQMALRYVNPAAKWSQYHKVLIAPVTFWGGEEAKIPQSDQQTLVNYFQQTLREQVGKKLQVVDQPGPGVLTLTVALTDAESATPVLRSISMIVPQAHMLSNLKYLATGTFPFVGGAQVEGKITDSVSGQVLAAGVDKRLGGGSFTTGFQWQWGDVENAMNFWSEQVANKLSAWTSGTERP
ncbi:DUF3313 domain-containing protein [Methylococcus sp. EFPC2]|uniref:DUF3313 domain-containing protein n=1 Tax=Methylococcus sp. EFPC2 TaxID=2812648 RepID=UPI0019673D20|nr:DUF3313 domain-containing protein [Methylococcus sp. EFPC2]QSA97851.1 DUF3313 domain-containing protein [Methylococcus sp. EFPC2]